MKSASSDLSNFLEERLGKALFCLRDSNREYRNLTDEFDALLSGQYQSIDEYRRVLNKLADLSKKIDDIEKHYLFLAGIREHISMKDALFSKSFEKIFIETK